MMGDGLERLAGRWRGRILLALVAVVATGVAAPTALAAPAVSITMKRANPYGLHGGVDPYTMSGETFAKESGDNTYTLTVTNNGTEPTTGGVVVRDKLPPEMVLAGNETGQLEKEIPEVTHGKEWACAVAAGGVSVECSSSEPLEPGKSYGPIILHVQVNRGAANPSKNVATVSGGGAPEASTTPAEGTTTVTEPVPFGIKSFTSSVVEQLGNPFTQAGGHPFEYLTELVFNYTTSDIQGGQVLGAGGGAKEVQVDLPPGFLGNPQNAPECPVASLRSGCPEDTAVGFVHVSLGGQIQPGGEVRVFPPPSAEFSSLVYNLEPTPGHAAELGFVVVKGTPVVLDAEVRSDGDYGVTVGSSAGPNVPRLMGVKLTTCEAGAVGASPNFFCNRLLGGSKPFLTNPTGCAGPAPITTARANAWDEPAEYARMGAYANAPSGPYSEANRPTHGTPVAASLITGCNALQFQPEIEFKPSPSTPKEESGTSQADEPTGITFGLKVPQSQEEPGVNATPELKNLVMTLPAGMTVSPSAADGLQACSNAQFWPSEKDEQEEAEGKVPQEETPEQRQAAEHREPAVVAKCPLKSKVGTVEVFTPLLSGAPSIEGVPRSGDELTCSEGEWTGSRTLSYQWLNNGQPIPGATGPEHKVAPGEEAIQCQVTATNGAGGSTVAVSRDVSVLPEPVPPQPLSSVPLPSGIPSVGNTLTCQTRREALTTSEGGEWSDNPETFEFQWLRNGEPIAGANSGPLSTSKFSPVSTFTYKLVLADEGKAIQCQVIAANKPGKSVAVSPEAVILPTPSPAPPVPPSSIAAPTGVAAVGGTLTCASGVWTGSPAFTYQWLRGAKAIAGAESEKYTLTVEDKGQAVQCQVTGKNAGGTAIADSRVVSLVPPFPPPNIAAPTGIAASGNTMTCASGQWTSSPTFSYRWLRGGVAISGAESNEYKLGPADERTTLQCQVIGTNLGGGTVIADSTPVITSPEPFTPPPMPGAPLKGQLFVAQPECSPCSNADAENGKLFRLFLQVQDPLKAHGPSAGVIVKLHGTTSANVLTGQLTTKFEGQPQQPLEVVRLKLNGGPRATLANSQSCGPAVTSAQVTPWSTPGLGGLTGEESVPGTPDATPSSQYSVDANGAGGACPGAWPFNPSFEAGTTGPAATTAGAFTQFSVTISRQDREQNLEGVQVRQPQGLSAMIASVPQCGESQANLGTCGPESQVGVTTTGAGAGEDPFFVGGKVYLTGPYKGAPFGLSIVVPAVAGPFNLGLVVVRSAISVDPHTAAATVTSDPLPQIRDGVPFRLRKVNVLINRPGFIFNPTNCNAQKVTATLGSAQGASAQVSSPFGVGGCGSLPFHPELTAAAGGIGSKANGTSFEVTVKSSPGQANIGKTFLQLPIALPSRLSTIQKACVAAVFEANPAGCPEGSNVGMAVAHTPVLKNPLVGPAYLVSHGNAAFPDVEFVLQGEGITLVLDGQTDIKKGITYSRFETVPDAPVSTFETVLPAGPHSALAGLAPDGGYNLCNTTLLMPTEITGQNGAVIKQNTHIKVTGCPKLGTPSVKIAAVKLSGNALLVTVKTGATGNVRVSGFGLTETRKHLTAGTHQLRVPLTKIGRSMRKHHKKTSVRVSLTVGKQAVAKTTALRL
jgi:uncharacterized repeat protein (TIGR01451 family)